MPEHCVSLNLQFRFSKKRKYHKCRNSLNKSRQKKSSNLLFEILRKMERTDYLRLQVLFHWFSLANTRPMYLVVCSWTNQLNESFLWIEEDKLTQF